MDKAIFELDWDRVRNSQAMLIKSSLASCWVEWDGLLDLAILVSGEFRCIDVYEGIFRLSPVTSHCPSGFWPGFPIKRNFGRSAVASMHSRSPW